MTMPLSSRKVCANCISESIQERSLSAVSSEWFKELLRDIAYRVENFASAAILKVLSDFFAFRISRGLITGWHLWLGAVVAEKRATT